MQAYSWIPTISLPSLVNSQLYWGDGLISIQPALAISPSQQRLDTSISFLLSEEKSHSQSLAGPREVTTIVGRGAQMNSLISIPGTVAGA